MRLHENPIWKSTLQRITCPSSRVIENFLATTWHLTVWDAINHGSHQSTMNQSVVNEACTVHISVFIKTRKYIIGWTVWVCKTEFQPHILGPGKGPGSSYKHPSTHNIIQQSHTSHNKSSTPSRRTFSQGTIIKIHGMLRYPTLSTPDSRLSQQPKNSKTWLI